MGELSPFFEHVDVASTYEDAIGLNLKTHYSLVVSDHFLNDKFSASCLYHALSEQEKSPKFGLMSGYPQHLSNDILKEISIIFIKPFDIDDMIQEIKAVFGMNEMGEVTKGL